MPECSFAIAVGHDAASPANVETIVSEPPHVMPAQLASYSGPVKRMLRSGATRRDGFISHRWTWDYMSRTDFNALITALFGGFTVSSAAVTIVTLNEAGNYAAFNAYVDKPVPDEDYRIADAGGGYWLLDVVLRFNNLQAISAIGEFTYEFTEEFT